MISNLIDEGLYVFCPECSNKKLVRQISTKHLEIHNLNREQFKNKYPKCYLMHPLREEKIKEARLKGKLEKEKILVTKPCWNYSHCNNNVENININVGGMYVICNTCKENGLIHPSLQKHKLELSKRAKKLNQDEEIIKKRTETLRNRTSQEIESWKNKREKTLIDKDGKNWKKIQHEKTKIGMLRNHGKEFALQVPELQQKAESTLLEKTGYKNAMHNPEHVKTVFEKRNQDEITKTTIETNIKKYSGPSPMCSPEIIDKANKTRLKTFLPRLHIFLSKVNLALLDDYSDCYFYNKYKCLKCNAIFESNWNQVQQGRLCPSCSNKFKPSKAENEIVDYIKSLGILNIIRSNRSIIKPYEIDIVLPDYNLCIEYCGLYTHREDILKQTRKRMKDIRLYHLYKLDECNKHGYNLITIFEDEWLFKDNIVKNMLKQRLNCNVDSPSIYARHCKICEIDFKSKRDFLNEFHIQGNDNSQVMIGAFSKDNVLVSAMTFSKPNISKGAKIPKDGHWELNRFCTNNNFRIPGIAGKLLKYFQRNYEWNYIYSYADRRWSSGKLYNTLGFTLESDPLKIRPNYWYIDKNKLKRIHRFALRIMKHENTDGLTEQQYRVVNGYGIIYDCGNLKFSIKNSLIKEG